MFLKKFSYFIFPLYFGFISFSPIHAGLFDSPYKKIAKLIAQKATDKNKVKIAVLTYQSLDEQNSKLGEIISEEIIVELVNNSSLNIVERSQVEKLLSELQFNQTGAIDAAAAKKIGNGLGADALVIGSFTSVQGGQIKVFTKLVDTETFQVLGASQDLIKKESRGGDEPEPQARKAAPPTSWSSFDVGFMTGINLPSSTISTHYTIDTTSYVFSGTTLEYDMPGIVVSSSLPLVLRTNL